jgi:hypothetical protein
MAQTVQISNYSKTLFIFSDDRPMPKMFKFFETTYNQLGIGILNDFLNDCFIGAICKTINVAQNVYIPCSLG